MYIERLHVSFAIIIGHYATLIRSLSHEFEQFGSLPSKHETLK